MEDNHSRNQRKQIVNRLIRRQKKQQRRWQWLGRLFFGLFALACIFFLIKFQTHQVSGRSMQPTLQDKERILVSRWSSPSRYDIVTFEPRDETKGTSYVKRVIGMPGDLIWIEGTTLYLNQQADHLTKNVYQEKLQAKELPDGTLKIAINQATAYELTELDKIPEDKFFVQGDNRNHSDDSRVFGLINRSQIEGVVCYRYFPLNKIGTVR